MPNSEASALTIRMLTTIKDRMRPELADEAELFRIAPDQDDRDFDTLAFVIIEAAGTSPLLKYYRW